MSQEVKLEKQVPQQQNKLEIIDQNLDDIDVYEPGSVDELISYLKRNFNALNESNIVARKKAIVNIQERLQQEEYRISGMISQQIMLKFNKQLLKTFADKAEKCREYSVRIFKELIGRCDDMTQFLPYIFSVITDRVNCNDLEGIQDLPEVMRPPPGQKPKRMIKLAEECEEVRLLLCQLMYDIVCSAVNNELVSHLDDVTNILRALAMDPNGDVQREACKTISALCRNNKEMLLHFTEIMARSILLPLISKKSKVRISALDALGSILYCGIWKYNAFVFEILVGFRDPNSVPIKDFYEPAHNINYFATLITDGKVQVREMFLRQAGDWIIDLDDRYDHHARLIPYVLSGLFDEHPDLRNTAFEILQEAGLNEETDKHSEIIEKKQYGIDAEWTCGGKLVNLPICEYVPQRPNLGARILIRGHVRKYWGALYKEIKDTNQESRIRASKLILIGVCFTEDFMTQHLDQFARTLIWYTVEKNASDTIVAKNISKTFELIGRFCPPSSYMYLIIAGLKGEFSKNDDYIKAVIKAFACLLKGTLEATVEGEGLTQQNIDFVCQVIEVIQDYDMLEYLSSNNFQEAGLLLSNLVTMVFEKATKRQLEEINMKGLGLMNKVGFIISYIALFDKTYVLTSLYNKEVTEKIIESIQNTQVHSLMLQVLQLEERPVEALVEFFKEANEEQIHFHSFQWKQVIGQILFIVYNYESLSKKNNADKLLIELLNDHFGVLYESIMMTNNPEVADFLAKFSLLVLNIIKSEKQVHDDVKQALYLGCVKLIGQVFYWMHNTSITMNKKIIINFQLLLKETAQACYSPENVKFFGQIVQNENDMRGFAKFIYQFPKNFRKYFKEQVLDIVSIINQVITQFLVPVFKDNSTMLEKLFVIEAPPKKLPPPPVFGEIIKFGEDKIVRENPGEEEKAEEEEIQEKKQEEENQNNIQTQQDKKEEEQEEEKLVTYYVIPILFQFALNRVEQLGNSPSMKMIQSCFQGLKALVQLVPVNENYFYKGSEYLIEDYEQFVNKLLKYTIDEKDIDQKQGFIDILKELVIITPHNFSMELEVAQKHKNHARIDILRKLCYKQI